MTEIEVYQPQRAEVAERDVVDGWLGVVSDVIKLANVIAPTEFVPEVYRDNPPAVAAAILAGRELALGPMTSLRHVQVVKGTPSLSAEYKRARILAAGHEFDILELNTTRCRVSGRRKGSNKPPLEITFTIDDAKRANLVKDKGAWQTRPRRMLFARASAELCDFLFSDVVNGLPTAELVADGVDGDQLAGYDESPAQQPPAPAARTARRRTTTSSGPAVTAGPATTETGQGTGKSGTAQRAAGSLSGSESAKAQEPPAASNLPPLPGEDDDAGTAPSGQPAGREPATAPAPSATEPPDQTDYDTPGTATKGHLTALWTILSKVFDFGAEEKEQARMVCAYIVGRDLASSSELSRNEAKAVLDTLNNWQAIAKERGKLPRDVLLAQMIAADQQDGAADGLASD